MAPPFWAISLAYWFHMLATVVWIGGLAALSILVMPAARRSLDEKAYPAFLARLQRQLDPLGWASLLVLVGTGLFQMSANPNYEGFLSVNNRWAAAILAKHLVFLAMTGVSAYLTWGLMPKMQRLALRLAAKQREDGQPGDDLPEVRSLQRQEGLLLRLNLILGVLVLALTALARAA
jgi:uncharacterized membrane protein